MPVNGRDRTPSECWWCPRMTVQLGNRRRHRRGRELHRVGCRCVCISRLLLQSSGPLHRYDSAGVKEGYYPAGRDQWSNLEGLAVWDARGRRRCTVRAAQVRPCQSQHATEEDECGEDSDMRRLFFVDDAPINHLYGCHAGAPRWRLWG